MQNLFLNMVLNARELKIHSCLPSQEESIFTVGTASKIVTVRILGDCLMRVKSVNFSVFSSLSVPHVF